MPRTSRREFLMAAGAGLASALLPGCAPGERRPNVLFVMADDVGAGELGCYGNPEPRTPHLDALAARGMRFRTCWSTPVCSPTRVMVMTGQYATRTGWYAFIGRPWSPVPGSPLFDLGAHFTFADALKSAGYATALAGKWQLPGALPTLVTDTGFDEYRIWAWLHPLPPGVRHTGRFEPTGQVARYWHPGVLCNGAYQPTRAGDYGPDLYCDFLIDFMRRHRSSPFFAYYPMALAHGPFEPTPDPEHPGRRIPGGYPGCITYMDHLIGRLWGELVSLGISERTLFVFTADNGSPRAGKHKTTEAGVRVPFIACRPGAIPAGVVSDALTDLSDVLPTFAELAGASVPADHPLDGRSLVPTLRGGSAQHREWIFSYLGRQKMLRDRRWLLQGDGTFYDCGDRRDGRDYRDVTRSRDPDVLRARRHFDEILAGLPGPEVFGRQLIQPRDVQPGGRFAPTADAGPATPSARPLAAAFGG